MVADIGIPQLLKGDLSDHQCVCCLEAATKQAPAYPLDYIAQDVLDLTHTDITRPISPLMLAKNNYVAVFLDDASRMGAVYFLVARSEIFQALIAYKALV